MALNVMFSGSCVFILGPQLEIPWNLLETLGYKAFLGEVGHSRTTLRFIPWLLSGCCLLAN